VWAGTVTPTGRKKCGNIASNPLAGEHAVQLKKGQEMGRFKLGLRLLSLCFEKDSIGILVMAEGDPTAG